MQTQQLPNNFVSGYVAIVGLANAGKSTLLNAMLDKKVSIISKKAQTTRDNVQGILNLEAAQIIFIDTPGFVKKEERSKLNRVLRGNLSEALQGSDLNVLLVDVLGLRREGRVEEVASFFKKQLSEKKYLVVLNKVDLLEKVELLPIIKKVAEVFSDNVGIIPISAEKGDGVPLLIQSIKNELPEGPQYFPTEVDTLQSQEFYLAEIVREKLFAGLNRELPYSVAVQVIKIEESEKLIRVFTEIIVERESQKAIIIGEKGSKLARIGKQARVEIEKSLDKKVYLENKVKVEKNWAKSFEGLKRVGY